MTSKIFGYARVSTKQQNELRQVEQLKEYGIAEEDIYTDKISGVRQDRPAMKDLMKQLREGDTLVILSFDRLARSLHDLLDYVERFEALGVNLVSLKEKIDTTTPQGKLWLNIAGSFAQYERDMIRQRQAEAYQIAKENGKSIGRPKKNEEAKRAAIALYEKGEMSVSEILAATGLSKATFYRALKE